MQALKNLPGGIDALLERSGGESVSLLQPAVRSGPEVRQNPIRFRNLVREAERRLKTAGEADPRRLLRPAEQLLRDTSFWRHPGEGLCVLASPRLSWASWLPIAVPEAAVVGDTFHVTPLLPLLVDAAYDILALSRDDARLYRGNRFGLEPVDIRDVVERVQGELGDVEAERELQFHTGAPARGGSRDAIFFGTGAGDPDPDEETLRRFRRIDTGLAERLTIPPAPLVLCGVGEILPIYRNASSHPRIVEGGVAVNAMELDPEELHGRTWSLVEPRFDAERREAIGEYRERSGRGDPRACERLEEILRGAVHGRVETLLVAAGVEPWGRFDPATGSVRRSRGRSERDESLQDAAVIETLRHGGRVFVTAADDVPAEDGIAAVLRF